MYPFLTDGDANLTEGSGFNIVLVKDGALYTPDRGVLHGVTRKIGPITKAIWDGYWAMHYDSAYSFEINYNALKGKL